MAAMRFLSEDQIRQIQAEAFAAEVADQAEALQRVASDAGMVLEIVSIADVFGVVTVRERNPHAHASRTAVPA